MFPYAWLVNAVFGLLLLTAASAAILWALRWALVSLVGWSPFDLSGVEILLTAILLFMVIGRAVEEELQDERERRKAAMRATGPDT
jgi:hypothetical protein